MIGAVCGAANNLIYGLTTGDNITLVYAFTSLCIGLAVGILARMGFMSTFPKSFVCALGGGLAAVLVSTPLNIIFWGGTTGNVWEMLYLLLHSWWNVSGNWFFIR